MAWNYPAYGFNNAPAYMPQAQMPAQQVNNAPVGFMCRPVTSRAEAEVYQIPFDGSTTYFVDTANGKIYAKTFNFANGTAPLVTYIQEAAMQVPKYATVEDLQKLREEILKEVKHESDE